jgi:DNA polymerase/3'-5' exonuclease PolX
MLEILGDICNRLGKLVSVKKVELARSARRMKESIGDADFLAVSNQRDEAAN